MHSLYFQAKRNLKKRLVDTIGKPDVQPPLSRAHCYTRDESAQREQTISV
jgi:hypothetical protein